MTTLIQRIAHSLYVANEQQVEAMAHERYTSDTTTRNTDETYLRVVIAEMQSKLGRRTRGRPNATAQAQVLTTAHDRYYPHILKGVTTPDIAVEADLPPPEQQRRALERNRRSNFARTVKSTILAYLNRGGDVRGLEVSQVTKSTLRAAGKPPEPGNKVERQIFRAKGLLLRALARQVRNNEELARTSIEATIAELEAMLDDIAAQVSDEPEEPVAKVAPVERRPQRTRVGIPQMHQNA